MTDTTSQTATRSHVALDSQRQGFVDQIKATAQDIERLASGLSDEQLNWRPSPDRWSIAECIEHLATTDGAILDRLEQYLQAARSNGVTGSGPFGYGLIGSLFVKSLEPGSSFKATAPAIYTPSSRLDGRSR
jgi:hypothetical protein